MHFYGACFGQLRETAKASLELFIATRSKPHNAGTQANSWNGRGPKGARLIKELEKGFVGINRETVDPFVGLEAEQQCKITRRKDEKDEKL